MASRTSSLRALGIFAVLAVTALVQLSLGDRWARIHTVDVPQILAGGVLPGIAVAGIVQFKRDHAGA